MVQDIQIAKSYLKREIRYYQIDPELVIRNVDLPQNIYSNFQIAKSYLEEVTRYGQIDTGCVIRDPGLPIKPLE